MRNFCRGKAYSRSYGDWENLSQCKLNVGILQVAQNDCQGTGGIGNRQWGTCSYTIE